MILPFLRSRLRSRFSCFFIFSFYVINTTLLRKNLLRKIKKLGNNKKRKRGHILRFVMEFNVLRA